MTLLNDDYIRNVIHRDAAWAGSHGSDRNGYLGGGLFYYTLTYMLRAHTCVCLGSAGGFVPRLMRQAQRDLALIGARTYLVDANIGHSIAVSATRTTSGAEYERRASHSWGLPQWLSAGSFFRTEFADIEILMRLTKDVAAEEGRNWHIDYLHIDADYSREGRLADFVDYASLMSPRGIMTLHDTDGSLPCSLALEDIRAEGHDVINFPDVGRGVALVRVRPKEHRR